MTLVDFLLARIAEDERNLDCGVNRHDGASSIDSPTSATCECDFRAKREVAAKREIVAEAMDQMGNRFGFVSLSVADRIRSRADTCGLRALAYVYSDHPDYREEWRP